MHKLSLTDPTQEPVIDTPTTSVDTQVSAQPSMPSLRSQTMNKSSVSGKFLIVTFAVLLGIFTGYSGYKLTAKTPAGQTADGTSVQRHPGDDVKVGDVFGSTDEKTFKDNAEGYLEFGGIDGEGSHKLLRPGGDNKTVYLTSSVIDLDKFQSMEIKVWGETNKGQKAGWLMDVGRVQVINLQGTVPTEE